jgi:hypothetical protein
MSPFLTSFNYAPGANDPHSLALFAEIREQLQGQPAIANASMFIGQLGAIVERFLAGSVAIRLDDAFATDLIVPVLLTFANTQALDAGGMSLQLDANGKSVLKNGSSFDMSVTRVGKGDVGARRSRPGGTDHRRVGISDHRFAQRLGWRPRSGGC